MIIAKARSLLRNLLRRNAAESRLSTELEGYIEGAAAELRAKGVSAEAARRQAIIAVGGVEDVKERVRDARAGAWLDSLLHDLRLAFRGLRRSPVFALATTTTLALGLGAAVTVLSIADAILIRPLPYAASDRLVTILQHGNDPVSPASFLDWKAAATSFSAVEGAGYWTMTITEGTPEQVEALHVTPGMMRMLGATPRLGTGFTGDASAREVVLSDVLWRRRFSGDTTIIGRTVNLDGAPYVVVAVMRPDFQFAPYWATKSQAWVSMDLLHSPTQRNASFLRIFARLRDGVTIASAQREMSVITARLAARFPESNRDIQVVSLRTKAIGNARPATIALIGAILCVLLITWVNVAHMLLARAYAREQELGVRVALGASRLRLVREALAESVLLASGGGVAAMVVADVALRLIAANGPFDLPQLRALAFDARAAVIGCALLAVTAVVVAVLPGLLASQVSRATNLRLTTRGATTTRGRTRLRQLLIASEMAFALILLVGTGLTVRTFAAMRAVNPGFVAEGAITMQIPMPRSIAAGASRAEWFTRMRERVLAAPGVREAGFINHLPLAGDEWGMKVFGGGFENAAENDVPRTVYRVATPGLTEAMSIRLIEGRSIETSDDLDHAGVVVVNRRLATQFWPRGSAIGRRISFDAPDQARRWLTVVGVVEDVKQSQWTAAADPEIYLPFAQARDYLDGAGPARSYLTLVARVTGDPAGVTSMVRQLVHDAEPTAVVTHIETLDSVVNRMTARARFLMSVLVGFGLLALVLAAVGIYGVLSYTVSQRRQELGIRIALGASAGAVTRTIALQTVLIALAGVTVGGVMAVSLTRLISAQLYGVAPHDPASFVGAGLALVVVAGLGALGPVRRAVSIDPTAAIK